MSAAFKLESLSIRNYKGIDELELKFPVPLPGAPDVTVIGSQNGVGKTSVLECCAMLAIPDMPAIADKGERILCDPKLIKAGKSEAFIRGDFAVGGKSISRTLRVISDSNNLSEEEFDILLDGTASRIFIDDINPLLEENMLYFSSYRRVREGSLSLSDVFERSNDASNFKKILITTIMGNAGLFENQQKDDEAYEKLNYLLQKYASVSIGKFKAPEKDKIALIVHKDDGTSFELDYLSSGQKEIISTLFLIWHATRNNPSLVLIDEPELHLNARWSKFFINDLTELAPDNQYIMATHSEEIVASAPAGGRLLLKER